MVEQASGYYGIHSKDCRRYMQGEPLFPKQFNITVDGIVMHWMTTVIEELEGLKGVNCTVEWMDNFFYTHVGHIVSTKP